MDVSIASESLQLVERGGVGLGGRANDASAAVIRLDVAPKTSGDEPLQVLYIGRSNDRVLIAGGNRQLSCQNHIAIEGASSGQARVSGVGPELRGPTLIGVESAT